MFDRERLAVARLGKSVGLEGEIEFKILSDFSERFEPGERYLCSNEEGSGCRILTIENVRSQGNKSIIKFNEIDTKEAADRIRGFFLSIDKEDAMPLDDDSWYVYELIGLKVEDRVHGDLGVLSEVLHYPASEILQVSKAGFEDLLIPVNAETLIDVDQDAGKIYVKMPEGLLEIYRP